MPGKVVSEDEWRAARLDLLEKEKAHTRRGDELNKIRNELPVTKVTKEYTFTGPKGPLKLADLFQGKAQLIVYHAMFDPSWDGPCKSCSFLIDQFPKHLKHLESRNTGVCLVSRAPYDKIEAFHKRIGWDLPWVSSNGSMFNYDFNVSLDESVAPSEYNFRSKEDWEAKGIPHHLEGEQPGLSVFVKEGDDIFHSYSSYGRGNEFLLTTYQLLDLTPMGRQDPSEPSGLGFKYHDEY